MWSIRKDNDWLEPQVNIHRSGRSSIVPADALWQMLVGAVLRAHDSDSQSGPPGGEILTVNTNSALESG